MAFRSIFKALLIGLALFSISVSASAQAFEVTPFFGGRFGGGIPIDPFVTEDNFLVAGVDLKSGAAFGFTLGAGLTENLQAEFLWSRQLTTARGNNATDTQSVDLIDLSADQYHGNILYQTGDEDDPMRPFIFGGIGATRFVPTGGLDSQTHFSFGFGGGVKFFFSERLGLRIQGRWAPTLLGKDDVVLCSINGCVVSNISRNVNQGELTGGLIIRF